MSLEIPKDPVELALEIALWRLADPFSKTFDGSREEELDLAWLDETADKANLIGGGWFVQAGLGYVIPKSFEADEDIIPHKFDGLYVEGKLACYSRLSIGKFLGHGAVRAICMTFDQGTLVVPEFTELEEDDLLLIPVLSVQEISRVI